MFKWVAHKSANIVEQGVDTSPYAILRAATCYHLFEFNDICENGGAKLLVANIWIGVLATILAGYRIYIWECPIDTEFLENRKVPEECPDVCRDFLEVVQKCSMWVYSLGFRVYLGIGCVRPCGVILSEEEATTAQMHGLRFLRFYVRLARWSMNEGI